MKIHFLLTLLPIVIASINSEEDAGLSAQPRTLQGIYIGIMSYNSISKLICLAQPEPVDLGLIYDYFTNDATSSRFMISIFFQVNTSLIFSLCQAFLTAIHTFVLVYIQSCWIRGDDLPVDNFPRRRPPRTGDQRGPRDGHHQPDLQRPERRHHRHPRRRLREF